VPRARCVTDQLVRLAREYSPRLEIHGDNLVVLDTTGLTSMFGDARELGENLRRSAADRGLYLRIAVAATRTAALLVVQDRSGLTVIEPGREAATLSILPLEVLRALAQGQAQASATRPRRGVRASGAALAIPAFTLLSTVRRWGLRTLGDLARLPSAELFERLGAGGMALQRFARGEDEGPLVPVPVEERFESSLVLEWPIEGLEPLSFVLSRVFEQLCARLERADLGAAVLRVHLKLVTRDVHTRILQLPTPLRDPRVLRTLVLLDLESHPPSAGIDQVTVVVDPVPARIQQFSLLERERPSPEKVSTLVARLTALAGEGRCGTPALIDSHDTAGFEMRAFVPEPLAPSSPGATASTVEPSDTRGGALPLAADTSRSGGSRGRARQQRGDMVRETPVDGDWRQVVGATEEASMLPMLRRFRVPVAARVRVRKGRPAGVMAPQMSGGEVVQWAGPWRTSGQWWTDAPAVSADTSPSRGPGVSSAWDRDEWDVSLTDGGVYRIFHDRQIDRWFLEGMVD
jgi:protein ImuB